MRDEWRAKWFHAEDSKSMETPENLGSSACTVFSDFDSVGRNCYLSEARP